MSCRMCKSYKAVMVSDAWLPRLHLVTDNKKKIRVIRIFVLFVIPEKCYHIYGLSPKILLILLILQDQVVLADLQMALTRWLPRIASPSVVM